MSVKVNVAKALAVTTFVNPATATADGSTVECLSMTGDAKRYPNIELQPGAGAVVTAGAEVSTRGEAAIWSSEGQLCAAQVGPGKFGIYTPTQKKRHPYWLTFNEWEVVRTDG